MSIFWNHVFTRSNASLLLCRGNALQSSVLKVNSKEQSFMLDSGRGNVQKCTQDELTGVSNNQASRFVNKVGYLEKVADKPPFIQKLYLERFLMDIIAGDPLAKERAISRFKACVGNLDMSEHPVTLPREFRQRQALAELKNMKKVNGFILDRMRGGYSVGIAGVVAFLPFLGERRRLRLPCNQFRAERVSRRY